MGAAKGRCHHNAGALRSLSPFRTKSDIAMDELQNLMAGGQELHALGGVRRHGLKHRPETWIAVFEKADADTKG
ncbi:hypothetical protein AB4099_20755 [Bosea sp. 2KB_26]